MEIFPQNFSHYVGVREQKYKKTNKQDRYPITLEEGWDNILICLPVGFPTSLEGSYFSNIWVATYKIEKKTKFK